MQQISNKTLTLLLLTAIVVSVGSTILSLNKLNELMPKTTGMVTTGQVNVTITSAASVNLVDSQINFGSCAPTGGSGCNVSSNSTGADCSCSDGTWPDNITVQNDGNSHINVTVQTNILAEDLIGGTRPEFWFMSRNASTRPGCFNQTGINGTSHIQYDWQNFSYVNFEYTACGNLTYNSSADQFSLFAKLRLPEDALIRTGRNATLTFTANSIT